MKQHELDFGRDSISRIILHLAPPVMFAQLIQALYNIVDSFFIGRYDEKGLTALSIIYPFQLLMIALAVGTGVGINTCIAHYNGLQDKRRSDDFAGVATPIAFVLWIIFAVTGYFIMPAYAKTSTDSATIITLTVQYGRIVGIFSIGLFMESVWTKIHQANGNMIRPMIAQIVGALVNICLDPIMIFGRFGCPELGIRGAAIATVIGQSIAAVIVFAGAFQKSPPLCDYGYYVIRTYRMGIPNIVMQSAYTFYILGLNMILATFCDQAVTVLGLYYKWQTFFFIPLGALQTCIVPVLSYNFAIADIERCRKTLKVSLFYGILLMAFGTMCFNVFPAKLLQTFSSDPLVISIGSWAFPVIGWSFLTMVTSLTFPVFFQATNCPLKSSLLTIFRTVCLFVPLAYIFSRFGLKWFWFTFPVTETVTTAIGFHFYRQFLNETLGTGVDVSFSEPQ